VGIIGPCALLDEIPSRAVIAPAGSGGDPHMTTSSKPRVKSKFKKAAIATELSRYANIISPSILKDNTRKSANTIQTNTSLYPRPKLYITYKKQ
jgi:hypothetical protein